jgi:integrase
VGDVRIPGVRDGLTKAQAEQGLRRMLEAERTPAPATRLTVEEAGRELSRRLEMRSRKKSHRLTVASDLRIHLSPFFGERTLDQITPEDIERYIATKRKTLAIKTIRNHVNTLHSVFELGQRHDWCTRNPVKLAERPVIKKTETRIQFLEQPELEKLLAIPYPPDAWGGVEPTLYLTAAMTGLRQGELLGLRWRDVDLEARKSGSSRRSCAASSPTRSQSAPDAPSRWPSV